MADGWVNTHNPRWLSDLLIRSYAEKGLLHTHFVRLAHHGPGGAGGKEHPFITGQIAAAKKNGYVGCLADSSKVWAACDVQDAAQVYVKALEKTAPAGSALHAIGEGDISLKCMADFIGQKLDLPTKAISEDEVVQSLGFVVMVMKVSGEETLATNTRKWLNWEPIGTPMFEQLETYTF